MLTPQTTYFGRLKQVAEIIPQNWFTFLALPLIGSVIASLLATVLPMIRVLPRSTPSILAIYSPIIYIILIVVISVMIQGITLLSQIKTIAKIDAGQTISPLPIIKESFSQLFNYWWLSVKITVYFLIPGLLIGLVVLLFAILGTLANMSVISPSLSSFFNFILGLAGTLGTFLVIILFIIRGPRTIFAYHLFVLNKLSAHQALKDSIEMSRGIWGKLVLHVLAFGVFMFIVNFIIELLPTSWPYNTIYSIVGILVDALSLSIWIIYTYLFLKFIQTHPTTPITSTPTTTPAPIA